MKGLVVEAAGEDLPAGGSAAAGDRRISGPVPQCGLWDLQWDGYAAHKRADAVYPVSVRAGA